MPREAGDNILIMGAGPIGLAILQCLKTCKPAVINPQEEDVISKCKLLCNGQGPEIAFDCAGVAASIKSACLSVRSRGTVVNVAKWDTEILFDMNDLLFESRNSMAAESSMIINKTSHIVRFDRLVGMLLCGI